jgi:hypothetical protein
MNTGLLKQVRGIACPRDTINNQSTAREVEDGKQIFGAFIFAAFNGGLKLAARG